MPELSFVFGPNGSFFFDCPGIWKFHNLPQTLRQLFNSSMSHEWRVTQPFCLSLAPQNNAPEAIWYLGCKVMSGEEKIFYSQDFFDQYYPGLSSWTNSVPRAPRSCFVTFGSGHSYFASAPGRGSVWAGIPSELSDKIQKAYDTPCCVALGVNNAWFVMWPDGYYSWKFHGAYKDLDQVLVEVEPRTVSYLAISPYSKEHYFVAFRNRTIKYDFTGAPREWMEHFQEVFAMWKAEIAQTQGRHHPQSQPQVYATQSPQNNPYAISQQMNPNLAPLPHHSPQPAYMSPQTPSTPMSVYSNVASTPLSPNSPMVYASYTERHSQIVEVMGDMPAPPVRLAAPPMQVDESASSDKKRKSLFKLFN